jgi:hypothetical protein
MAWIFGREFDWPATLKNPLGAKPPAIMATRVRIAARREIREIWVRFAFIRFSVPSLWYGLRLLAVLSLPPGQVQERQVARRLCERGFLI